VSGDDETVGGQQQHDRLAHLEAEVAELKNHLAELLARLRATGARPTSP
jgi:hypothetical protein